MPNFAASSSACWVSGSSSETPEARAAFPARSRSSSVHFFRLRDLPLAHFQNRQDLFDHDPLRDHRLEFVEDQVGRVDLLTDVAIGDFPAQIGDAVEGELVEHARMVADNLDRTLALAAPLRRRRMRRAVLPFVRMRAAFLRLNKSRRGIAAAEKVAAFAADGIDVDLEIAFFRDETEGRLRDISVEGPGKSLVAGNNDERHGLLRARQQERMANFSALGIVDLDAPRERADHARKHRSVGTRGNGALLGAPQLGRRH